MDIIADSLTKLRNASMRRLPHTSVRKTNMVGNILNILKKEGYILDYSNDRDNPYFYTVYLKYTPDRKAVISGIKRASKLSRRLYVKKDSIPRVYNNLGIAIISTSKGVLTDKEARALGIGGEVICYVW